MKSAAERLTIKERRTLAGLGAALVLVVLFLVVVALGQRRGYFGSLEAAGNLRLEAGTAEAERDSAKAGAQAWTEARRDLDKLRSETFYQKDEGISRLRLDLQQVLGPFGVSPRDLKFDYVDYEKDKAQKVTATFTFSGTYGTLRRFLFAVEKFPRLLYVERVNFVSIEPRSGTLNLKISMVAYYEL
jgi:Tfp pilus assembly protein PilO